MVAADEHRHCKVCGKVCDPAAETCSKACTRERERRAETRRNYTYFFYAMIAFLALILAASFLHF